MAKKVDYAEQFRSMLAMIEPQMIEKFSENEIEYMRQPVGLTMLDEANVAGIDARALARKIRELDLAGKLWLRNRVA